MNTYLSIRYPPPNSPRTPPIIVTQDGIESLLFCIVHTIEFLSTQGLSGSPGGSAPGTADSNRLSARSAELSASLSRLATSRGDAAVTEPMPSSTGLSDLRRDEARRMGFVMPVVSCSNMLGGVRYVACAQHNSTLLSALPRAVEDAKRLPFPSLGGSASSPSSMVRFSPATRTSHVYPAAAMAEAVHVWNSSVALDLRVRVSSEAMRKMLFVELKRQVPIVEWVFTIVKTRGGDAGDSGNSAALRHGRVVDPSSPLEPTPALPGAPNNPAQIRRVLQFITAKMFDSIDTNFYMSYHGASLVYELSVEKNTQFTAF